MLPPAGLSGYELWPSRRCQFGSLAGRSCRFAELESEIDDLAHELSRLAGHTVVQGSPRQSGQLIDRLPDGADVRTHRSHPFGVFEAKQGNLLGKREVQGVYRLDRAERRIERRREYRGRRVGAAEVLLDRRPATLYRSAAEGYPLRRAQAVLGQGAPIAFHAIAKMSMIGGRNQQGQLRVAELQKMSRAAMGRVEIIRADRIEVRMASGAVDQNRWREPRGETWRRPEFILSGHHEQAVNLSGDERLDTSCF